MSATIKKVTTKEKWSKSKFSLLCGAFCQTLTQVFAYSENFGIDFVVGVYVF